jgi:hypothetical protein
LSEGQNIEGTVRQGDPQKRWGLGRILFVIVLGLFLFALIIPTQGRMTDKAYQMKATSNCRQVMMAMKAYAADNVGKYPTGRTANELFRELIRGDILQDERIFGCPFSRYVPDDNMGLAPSYDKAVRPGENHWMVVDGLKDDSPALTPLVFENALEATWPPYWDGSAYGKVRQRGQTWKKGKIILGLNDNSVSVEKLGGKDLKRQTVQPGPDGKSIFDLVPNAVVLDIEE